MPNYNDYAAKEGQNNSAPQSQIQNDGAMYSNDLSIINTSSSSYVHLVMFPPCPER